MIITAQQDGIQGPTKFAGGRLQFAFGQLAAHHQMCIWLERAYTAWHGWYSGYSYKRAMIVTMPNATYAFNGCWPTSCTWDMGHSDLTEPAPFVEFVYDSVAWYARGITA